MTLQAMQRSMRDWLQVGDGDLPDRFEPATAPGLRVYQNNYRAQLVSCLEQSFPHTRAWIGERAFFAACAEQVCEVTPVSWTIDDYAAGFPARLAAIYPDDDEVTELAWIELALDRAFVSADAPSLTAAQLNAVDWDSARLRLAPSMLSRPARTNAGAIWSTLEAGAVPPAFEALAAGCVYLVWRSGFDARFRTLDADEAETLASIERGSTFAELCSGLIEQRGESDGIRIAGEWLGRWIADGLICGVDA